MILLLLIVKILFSPQSLNGHVDLANVEMADTRTCIENKYNICNLHIHISKIIIATTCSNCCMRYKLHIHVDDISFLLQPLVPASST